MGGEESSYWLTYVGCLMDEVSHHRHLPSVLAKELSRMLVSSLNWLKTSLEKRCPFTPSLARSPYPLCFGISVSPHPTGSCLEIPEVVLRDSAAEFTTVPEQASPCRGKSLARKDLFWPMGR